MLAQQRCSGSACSRPVKGAFMKRIMLGALAAVLVSACGGTDASSNPTTSQALNQIGTSFCSMLQGCYSTAFNTAYPQGSSQCVQAMMSASFAKGIDPNAHDACSQSEIDACVHDIGVMGCPATVPTTLQGLPTSCQKC